MPDQIPRPITMSGLNVALLLTLLGSWGGGAWYMATQAAANASMEKRLAHLETSTSIGNRLDTIDKRDDARANAITSLDIRLTRAEAQLGYLGVAKGTRQ
jgi:hypothetical protein